MRQVLAWAVTRDTALALRLADALSWWWFLRGRRAGAYPLVYQAAGRAEVGSDGWCTAQVWLGWTAQFRSDPAAALGHFTAVRDAVADRPPSRALTAALAGRAAILRLMGRAAEAASDARRSLALARQIGDPIGELLALADLSFDADYVGHHDEAVRLARQARQITAGIPGSLVRMCSYVLTMVLINAGDLAEAARVGAAALTRARDAGDLWNQAVLLPRIVDLDLRAGRTGDAAAHLREGLQVAVRAGSWFELLTGLSQCGDLCAATGRAAEALTLWASATAAVDRHGRIADPPWSAPSREEQLRQARLALGPGRARAAEDRGMAMSLATGVEYALLLTDPGPPQPTALGSGQLSARERELVRLVAQGRTNAQIAAELYISARTVGSHLDRIRDKTGCRRACRPDPPGPGRRPGLARPATGPGTPGRRATRSAERPGLHAPADERNNPHDRADRRLLARCCRSPGRRTGFGRRRGCAHLLPAGPLDPDRVPGGTPWSGPAWPGIRTR